MHYGHRCVGERGGGRRAARSDARPDQSKCSLSLPPTDEAGRGPVLGPMVYASALAPASDEAAVARMSFADSKALTETIREALFIDILAHPRLSHRVESLSAPSISAAMLGRARISLNALASDATVALVRGALDSGANVAHVYVDTVGDAGRWAEALRSKVRVW